MLAIGGLRVAGMAGHPDAPPLLTFAAALTGRTMPGVCILCTATGDNPGSFLRIYEVACRLPARVTHLQLFPQPNVADPADLLLSQDMIFVDGGSVANMLAVWRVHGIDQILRSAWHAGIVLAGVSAGAICWFNGGTTDSFGTELRPYRDGLGLLSGSFCPHYDSEPARRPVYRSLVADGTLPAGIACDDGAAAHFTDDDLAEIVADRPGADGYLVAQCDGAVTERPFGARLLPGQLAD